MTMIRAPRRRRYRSVAAVAAVTFGVAGLVVTALVVIGRSGAPQDTGHITRSERTAFVQWWSSTYGEVTALQNALDAAQRSVHRGDRPGLTAACQRMHDIAAVELVAHLPAPQPDLSAELEAAATDAHAAAHMCLSVLEQTQNSYDAEFVSDVDQADRQLKAAVADANKYLAGESTGSAGQ